MIDDYLDKLYAFSLRQTRNRDDAEDLCQDIVAEIVYSATAIRRPEALPGWVWAIARNTNARWIRKRQVDCEHRAPFPPSDLPAWGLSPEQQVIAGEELDLMRREIGLLSRAHREVVVQHHLNGRSCADIAASMHLSESMVKYHLFNARKKIKEGVSMARERGAKSYDPGHLTGCMWSPEDTGRVFDEFLGLVNRLLPGSILSAAYAKPVTVQDIGLETGVPVPYIEDEIQILEDSGLLNAQSGGRYQTSLFIIDSEVCAILARLFAERGTAMADQLFAAFKTNEKAIRDIGFHGSDMDWSQLVWLIPNVMQLVVKRLNPEFLSYYPLLKSGIHAWQWAQEETYHSWTGMSGVTADHQGHSLVSCDFGWLGPPYPRCLDRASITILATMTGPGIAVSDLTPTETSICAQLVEEGFASNEGGRLLSRVPVFATGEQFLSFRQIINSEMGFVEAWYRQMHEEIVAVMRTQMPKRFNAELSQFAFLKMLYARAYVMEALHSDGRLKIPRTSERISYALLIAPTDV